MRNYDIVIVGGGSAGITAAARMKKRGFFKSIAVIEPSDTHFYQPLWTLVGGGLVDKNITKKPMKSVIPKGVEWIKESVVELCPENNKVKTDQGEIGYQYLIVASGIVPDWTFAKGLKETIGKNNVCSVYTFETASYCFETVKDLEGGKLFFTMPQGLLKCGGAPQKIMWLTEDYLSRHKSRSNFVVNFVKEGDGIFGVEKYKKRLEKMAQERDIHTLFHSKLIEVDGEKRQAVFKNLQTGEETRTDYNLLHVVPHFKTHDFVSSSPLANDKGEIDVDKHTLQSVKFPNVFSLGDCSSCPTGKTGAAVRKEAPVLVENLHAYHQKQPMTASYNGYTACPIISRHNRVILAEFDYDGNPQESFPFDQSKESYLLYLFKRYALPQLYWKLMLRGLA